MDRDIPGYVRKFRDQVHGSMGALELQGKDFGKNHCELVSYYNPGEEPHGVRKALRDDGSPEAGKMSWKGASQNYSNKPGKRRRGKAGVAWVSILMTIFLCLSL